MVKNLMNKLNNKKNKKGFTLIELIIVIAIIAILAALLLPKLGQVKQNSNKTSDVANAKKIAEATLTLFADDKIADTFTAVTLDDGAVDTTADLIEDYIQSVPVGKTKAVAGDKFTVEMNGGNVTVKLGGVVAYPDPASTFNQQ